MQVSHRKNIPPELDPVTEGDMQSTLDVTSTSLDMSVSTTARHFPHIALEIRHAETARTAQLRQLR
jgi:hypothetical protein